MGSCFSSYRANTSATREQNICERRSQPSTNLDFHSLNHIPPSPAIQGDHQEASSSNVLDERHKDVKTPRSSTETRTKRSANFVFSTANGVLQFISKRSRFSFRSSSSPHVATISERGISSAQHSFEEALLPLFLRYVNVEDERLVDVNDNLAMGLEGVVRFLEDLNLAADDFRVLLFAWHCQATLQCRFLWSEFVRGCLALQANTIPALLESLTRRQSEVLHEDGEFMALYKWAFLYCLDGEHQRCLKKEDALAMWRVLFESAFHPPSPSLLHPPSGAGSPSSDEYNSINDMIRAWIDFLKENHSVKVISQDTWDMFLKFLQVVGRDSSQYNDADAWPTLMDQFMESQLATHLRSGEAFSTHHNNNNIHLH